jgi:hypothetical protein
MYKFIHCLRIIPKLYYLSEKNFGVSNQLEDWEICDICPLTGIVFSIFIASMIWFQYLRVYVALTLKIQPLGRVYLLQ